MEAMRCSETSVDLQRTTRALYPRRQNSSGYIVVRLSDCYNRNWDFHGGEVSYTLYVFKDDHVQDYMLWDQNMSCYLL
jgi:hypothetical protein